MSTEMKKELPWWQKYTLTLNEASEYFGIERDFSKAENLENTAF